MHSSDNLLAGKRAEALQAAGGRVRQHVNPLKSRFQAPAKPPDWSEVYADPSLPLVLDIGCAAGRFLLEMAERLPGHNCLGLDIREPVSNY